MKAKTPVARSGKPIDTRAVKASAVKRDIQLLGIGRFMFAFSQLEFSIRHVLIARLGISQEYFNIVTGPYDFTKLCTVTREASIVKYPTKQDEIKGLFKSCLKLNRSRVLIAHGMWLDDLDGLSLRIVGGDDFRTEVHSFKADELERLCAKAQELMQRVMGFQGRR